MLKDDHTRPKNFFDPHTFKGNIKRAEISIDTEFDLTVDHRGLITVAFPEMPMTADLLRISYSNEDGGMVKNVAINGVSETGQRFLSDRMYFSNVKTFSGEEKNSVTLTGACTEAKLTTPILREEKEVGEQQYGVRFWLRGIEGFHALSEEVEGGIVNLSCPSEIDDIDELTGVLQFLTTSKPDIYEEAEERNAKLLERVLVILSLASGSYVKPRIETYYRHDEIIHIIRNHASNRIKGIESFHHLNLGPIFTCAVRNAAEQPSRVDNVRFAIEWLLMQTAQAEVRLISYMTALEHLVSHNLSSNERTKFPRTEFSKYRKHISKALDEIGVDENSIKSLVPQNHLPLRTLIVKLCNKWNVSLCDINELDIKGFVDTRNKVIHTGTSFSLSEGSKPDGSLWKKAMIAREVAIRLTLAHLEYEGSYFSMMGGWHMRNFPSCERAN